MKEIKMDFETYEKECHDKWNEGFEQGREQLECYIVSYLESDKKLYAFIGDNIQEDSFWGRMALALGRQDEMKRPGIVTSPFKMDREASVKRSCTRKSLRVHEKQKLNVEEKITVALDKEIK